MIYLQDCVRYQSTLISTHRTYRFSTPSHIKVGHVLGLHHKFATKRDALGNGLEAQPAVQFGSKNPISVMNYEDVVYVQGTDKHDIAEFYKLPNRYEIEGVKVADFIMKPLSVNP